MRQRMILMLLITLPCVGLDQWSKMQATAHLAGKPAQVYFEGILRLQYALNPGAWGSLGASLPDPVRKAVFTLGVGAVLAVLAVYILRNQHSKLMTSALSLVLAGGLGNLIDRALYGHVVDFLYLGYAGISWMHTNIFNVADVAIMAGAGLLLLHALTEGRKPEPGSDGAEVSELESSQEPAQK
ncbi:signal peptidase II [bacterium (Candidatus Blackallbacteria) CG17_big_fil_post_rev_8_21_14_2_50_48_46]|uniref:Lipoprotein signal peptidase n=1 Tax=bacterium (Candidatus Blackallbacteria) CG17_big_fil_post_rev_8_21_14_2_50_48_46 TaxID=2014261 RepID=A0A2M7G2D7_9BACT|nr:MAG: signal peptidase II [bacterium (Candidatus Blackallbacteria) CG18_big_fil_WC_8_21_14_2_50_49_26]PIW15956.1 MAG: signal peptidase II [bacterium (Candidatus Blackallbacteria) CG17_big_fil_post_rev_8_21_14_2_50_48_46]PIW50368.1 MAG: signal peptidase II [bacterium (Candidatus Blackallbacteria) CG13_big_fil_rev_8_21_14_2_50_49_14]